MATLRHVDNCKGRDATRASYQRAASWIEAHGSLFARKVLAMQRETVEARAPVAEGGDGSLSPCAVARRRQDIVGVALADGFRDTWTNPAEPLVPPGTRPPCPAADAIRRTTSGTHAYMVGKGPSLDTLTPADFDDEAAPVLAANEAVLRIEQLGLPNPVFGVQQDRRLGTRARPQHAYWLLSRQAWRQGEGDTHPGAVMYDPEMIGGSTKSLTANQTLRMLGIAGFRQVTAYAFDACTSGDCGYAESTGSDPLEFKQKPDRFRGYCREIARVAQHEGITLVYAPPHDHWHVVCVMRSGGRYDAGHVEWLRRQVRERLTNPHTFHCLTDQPKGINGSILLRHGWPGWWSKPEMFRAGLFAGGVMYLDLDVVLPRPVTLPEWHTLEAGTLYAVPDFMRRGEINSSVMMWRGDAGAEIYRRMAANPDEIMRDHHSHGDQQFESEVMAGRIKPPPLAVKSYKVDKPSPDDTDVVVFHGDPKPWQVKDAWIPPLKSRVWRWEFLCGLIRERGYDVAVEVGVKEGKTSEAILRDCPSITRLYSIDMFQGQDVPPADQGAENYADWNWDGIIADYRRRIEPHRDRCVTIIGDAIACAELVPAGVGLVFLDADHREEPTRQAIRAWRPKLRPGGILAGHDIDWPSVRAAVQSEIGTYETGPDNVWWVTV